MRGRRLHHIGQRTTLEEVPRVQAEASSRKARPPVPPGKEVDDRAQKGANAVNRDLILREGPLVRIQATPDVEVVGHTLAVDPGRVPTPEADQEHELEAVVIRNRIDQPCQVAVSVSLASIPELMKKNCKISSHRTVKLTKW